MFRLPNTPNHNFKDLLNCIAFDQVQQIFAENLDPQPFIEKNLETENFSKVLATHCVLKKNLKPIMSVLLLVTDDDFSNLAVYQYIIKPTPSKLHDTLMPLYEVKKIWEIGRLFDAMENISLHETLYKSKSPRLFESGSFEVFLNSVSSRSNDFHNKDSRSLSKSSMLYDIKVESLIPLLIEDQGAPLCPTPNAVNIISITKLQQIIANIENTLPPQFNVENGQLYFQLNNSLTKISFDIEYVKKHPNTIFNELLYLSIDPYIILESFKALGIHFPHLCYNKAKTLIRSLALDELLQFKGLESHFDLVVLELYKRKDIC